jgi:hypothetical protein
MNKIFHDCFTGVDGQSYDLLRILWAAGISAPILIAFVQCVGAVLSLWRLTVHLPLWTTQDWTTWAAAIAGLMLAGAGALYMKRATEPSATLVQKTDDGDGNSSTIVAKT